MTSTTQLVHALDIPGDSVKLLHGQFQDKPRIVAFVEALGAGAQQLEDVHWDLLVGCTLDNSTGDQLDQWGDIVGEPRGGLEDWDYRVFIKARIMANRCTGTLDELIRIFQIVTAPSVVTSKEIFPKHLTLRAYRDAFMDAPRRGRVHAMMTAIHPAGTFLQIEEWTPSSMVLSGSPRLGVGGLSRLI